MLEAVPVEVGQTFARTFVTVAVRVQPDTVCDIIGTLGDVIGCTMSSRKEKCTFLAQFDYQEVD